MGGEIPMANRSLKFETTTLGIRERLEEIADRHWRFRNLKPKTLVPMLEAAHRFRDHQRRQKGIGAELAALTWFWDKFAESLLNGDFDRLAEVYVLGDQSIFGSRGRPGSEYGYRFTSVHMKALTADAYTYDDVLRRCFAHAWCSLQTAVDWCELRGLPIPPRWQTGSAHIAKQRRQRDADQPPTKVIEPLAVNEESSRLPRANTLAPTSERLALRSSGRGRPPLAEWFKNEFDRRLAAGDYLNNDAAEAHWLYDHRPEDVSAQVSTIRKAIRLWKSAALKSKRI